MTQFSRIWFVGLIASTSAAPLTAQPKKTTVPGAVPPPSAPPVVLLEAMDFAFKVPPTAPPGLVTLRLKNTGKSLHHVQLARMNSGQTLAEFMTQLRKSPGSPGWREVEGGPSWAQSGQTAEVQLILAPGTYAVWCWIPSADGQPHYMKGMYSKMEVVGGTPSKRADLVGDISVVLSDYSFSLSAPLTSGLHTFRIENAGPQAHEFTIVKLAAGKTALDVLRWMEGGQQTSAPGRLVGGTSSIAQGRVIGVTLGITPGEYALICFTPEHLKRSGKPHADMGMMKTLTVQ